MHIMRKLSVVFFSSVAFFGSSLLPSSLQAQALDPHLNPSGTWLQTISIQGEPSFQGLVTFTADGTLTETTQGDFAPPNIASPGHGLWQPNGFASIRIKADQFLFLASSPGTPNGMNVTTGTVVFENDNLFKASGTVEVYSSTGQEVLSLPFTTEGTRVTLR